MSALTKALTTSRAFVATTETQAFADKAAGVLDLTPTSGGGFDQLNQFREGGANRVRYQLNRGWTYAAINAIACEGADQEVKMGKIENAAPNPDNDAKAPRGTKSLFARRKMPRQLRQKAATQEMELIESHPLLDSIAQPNAVQNQRSFVYSFIANLNLTGWSYVVGGPTEDGKIEFYSIPTTWVKPIHDDGPFSHIKIVNPRDPGSEANAEPISRDNFAFCHLPNPSDPLSALAPAQAMMMAIRIDDHIQTSQERFFENGIFPSVIVTIGKDPHPDIPGGGNRPRLTGAQRRQVIGAIRKVVGGVANYGNPAIVDGLVEKIERLSATSNEMGWEKSEKSARTRILSAFGVHPYILGEAVSVGGHAQTFNIEKRFHRRVNMFLGMLSTMMTNFAGPMTDLEERTVVWWEECETIDRSIESQEWKSARANNDVSQDEFRAYMGLPPDEDRNEQLIEKSSVAQIVAMLGMIGQGAATNEQVLAMLEGMGLPTELAERIAGKPGEVEVAQQATEELAKVVAMMKSGEFEQAVQNRVVGLLTEAKKQSA